MVRLQGLDNGILPRRRKVPESIVQNVYTHLIIGDEAGLSGEGSGLATLGGRGPHFVVGGRGEGEGAAIQTHADDELLSRGALLDPVLGGEVLEGKSKGFPEGSSRVHSDD